MKIFKSFGFIILSPERVRFFAHGVYVYIMHRQANERAEKLNFKDDQSFIAFRKCAIRRLLVLGESLS